MASRDRVLQPCAWATTSSWLPEMSSFATPLLGFFAKRECTALELNRKKPRQKNASKLASMPMASQRTLIDSNTVEDGDIVVRRKAGYPRGTKAVRSKP